jgi:hypothetical protein
VAGPTTFESYTKNVEVWHKQTLARKRLEIGMGLENSSSSSSSNPSSPSSVSRSGYQFPSSAAEVPPTRVLFGWDGADSHALTSTMLGMGMGMGEREQFFVERGTDKLFAAVPVDASMSDP